MDGRRNGGLVFESAHDGQLLLERRERLENWRQLEARPFSCRCPLVHDGAVRQIEKPHARLWTCCGLGQRGPRRDHRVQQRQTDRDTRAAKKCAPGEMLLRDEHGQTSSLKSAV